MDGEGEGEIEYAIVDGAWGGWVEHFETGARLERLFLQARGNSGLPWRIHSG